MFKMELDLEEVTIPGEKEWKQVAEGMRNGILDLMHKSTNADGQPLQPYEAGYKKWKTKGGLSGQVDFKVTGQYLGSIKYRGYTGGFEVFLHGAEANKKGRFLESRKNWQIWVWNKELEKTLDHMLQQMLKHVGLA